MSMADGDGVGNNNSDGSNLRKGVFAKIVDAINHNPIPTLILVTGVITFIFWNKVDAAISALNNAVLRIDTVVRESAINNTNIVQIKDEVNKLNEKLDMFNVKIGELQMAFDRFPATLQRIELRLNQLNSREPYEVRVIESFGIHVDSDLIVQVVQGTPTAFPLTVAKETELKNAHFQRTSSSITTPKYAVGWIPPTMGQPN